MNNLWSEYYSLTKNRPPSTLLVQALQYVQKRGVALDLGSGALKDSRFLIQSDFKKIIAVDKEDCPTDLLNSISSSRFIFIKSQFDEFDFTKYKYDLINAQYSLPFNSKDPFKQVWNSIKRSLESEGVFAGQFFGINDEWNLLETKMTFLTKGAVEKLFSDFEVLSFKEEEKDGVTANGQPKHWHLFHVIAKMRSL
jgi:hypothetical protein